MNEYFIMKAKINIITKHSGDSDCHNMAFKLT